eukprot:258186_1
MSQSIWPITIDDIKFDQPYINDRKCSINNKNFINIIEDNPKLWCHLIKNKNSLTDELSTYMMNIASKFEPEIPNGTLARIKVPGSDWQSDICNRYVRIEFAHCENYASYLLPFHDPEHQYCGFFLDIEQSVKNNRLNFHWNENEESDGTYEEFVWLSEENIEIIYAPSSTDQQHHKTIGMKDTFLHYMKSLCNRHVNEIVESSTDALKILMLRLRGKCRCGTFGNITSVTGTISDSQRYNIEGMVSEIVDRDASFESKTKGDISSYKLSRSQLFGSLKINAGYLVRIFDVYGKERKLHRSISTFELFDDNCVGYNDGLKTLLNKTFDKYKKQKIVINELSSFNGIRITFNNRTHGIKINTNTFCSKLDEENIDVAKQKFPIKEELGRKGGW